MSPEEIRDRVRARLLEQRRLTEELLEWREQLRGSLFVRYGQCGKPSCLCRQGQRHGPYYVLSTRSRGQGGFTYLDESQIEQARQLVRFHRRFKTGLRRLRKTNEQLVTLLRRYQDAMSRRGGRRLGLPPAVIA